MDILTWVVSWIIAWTPPTNIGYAAHYSPGLMERVAQKRGIDPHTCMIAFDGKIGTHVLVKSEHGTAWCTTVDVVHPHDRAALRRRRIIVELDFGTAQRLCNITRVRERPPRECPVTIWRMP